MAEITAADTTPKITDEIKKAYYELIASHAADRSSDETKSLLADFAKLLPAEEEARHNMLATLKSYLKSAQSKGEIKLRPGTAAIVRKNLGKVADNIKDDLDKIAPVRKKTLTDDERQQKLAALKQVYSEALSAPETIKNQQRELKYIRHDRVFSDKPLNESEKKYAEQIRGLAIGAGANLDGITAEEILLTCRQAVEEKALQTFKEVCKAELTPEKVKEIEQQMRAFDLRTRIKGKTITLSEDEKTKRKDAQKAFVDKLQTAFVKEQGYALWGGNGNILKTLREAINEYKKENGLTRDKDDRKKDDTRKDKPKGKGDRDMADDKEMDLAEALKIYKNAYGMAQTDKPDAGATKQMYAALDIMLNDAEKLDHEASKKAYEALMKAEEDKLKKAVEALEDGEFKDGALGALFAHKNRAKFDELGIPEEDRAAITSAEKLAEWQAAHPKDRDTKDNDPLLPREGEPDPNPNPEDDRKWVEEKAIWYRDYQSKKNLSNFAITREDDQFEVKFEGGTIHYETKHNVSISPGASYKVYEALLREDHNKDRPVQFPANASEHLTSMLYAASILNETSEPEHKPHEMLGVDKTKINMSLIEAQLRAAGYGDAEVKKVKDYYDTHEGKPEEEHTDEHSSSDEHRGVDLSLDGTKNLSAENRDYTVERNGNEVVIKGVEITGKDGDGKDVKEETFTFSYNTETKDYSYTDKKDGKEYTNAEDEGSQPLPTEDFNFLKDKAEKFIQIQSDLDIQIKLAKIEAANDGKLTPENGKEQKESRLRLVEAYGKDPALFRRAMGGLIGNTTAESKEHEDLRAAQIAMLRAKAEENGKLKEHDEKVEKRDAARERLLVLRGIKPNDDGKILGEDGKTPVQTDKTLAKELSDNRKEFNLAKAKDKDLTLRDFITDKYKDKGLDKDAMEAKITTQATYNFQVEKYGKPEATR